MARIRTIKPEFWQDEKLAPLPAIDRLVFLGLISQADDAGRLVDNPRMLDGLIFPETDDSCRGSLETLQKLGRIIRYNSHSGQRLIQIVGWVKHQNVQKPSTYVLPAPPSNGHSGDVPESPPKDSGDFPSPIPDPRSVIPDLHPPTVDPHTREEAPDDDGGRENAIAEMTTDLNVELERVHESVRPKLRAAGQSLIDGDARNAWLDPRTGGADVVPWPTRPAIFRLALADCLSEGETTQKAFAAKVKYHAMRELDPLPPKRPPASSEARRVTNEMPQQHGKRTGRATRVDGKDPEMERRRRENDEADQINRWIAANPGDVAVMQQKIATERGAESWSSMSQIDRVAALGQLRRLVADRLRSEAA